MTDEAPERGPRWSVDLHTHTSASPDCLSRPKAVVAAARRSGLDRVAVTDHDRIEGAFRARDADPELVIVGEEVRTADGPELIGLFLERFVPPGLSFRETAAAVREQGGVTYLPHPFDPGRGTTGAFLDEHAGCVDLVERFNARTHDPARNRRAREWAAERGLPVGAGSDAHLLWEIGRGRLRVAPFRTPAEMLEAAREGRVEGETSGRWVHLGSTAARLLSPFVR